jgi:hypothetical protein
MRDEKTKQCKSSNFVSPYNPLKLKAQRVIPINIVLNKVFAIAKIKIVAKFSKNGLQVIL